MSIYLALRRLRASLPRNKNIKGSLRKSDPRPRIKDHYVAVQETRWWGKDCNRGGETVITRWTRFWSFFPQILTPFSQILTPFLRFWPLFLDFDPFFFVEILPLLWTIPPFAFFLVSYRFNFNFQFPGCIDCHHSPFLGLPCSKGEIQFSSLDMLFSKKISHTSISEAKNNKSA